MTHDTSNVIKRLEDAGKVHLQRKTIVLKNFQFLTWICQGAERLRKSCWLERTQVQDTHVYLLKSLSLCLGL